jgi:hypothetical protein
MRLARSLVNVGSGIATSFSQMSREVRWLAPKFSADQHNVVDQFKKYVAIELILAAIKPDGRCFHLIACAT